LGDAEPSALHPPELQGESDHTLVRPLLGRHKRANGVVALLGGDQLSSDRSTTLEPGTSARVADASVRGRRRAGSREYRLFLLATGLVGLHNADDNYLQPEPGTSAGDHLTSGLVPLGLLAVLARVASSAFRAARRVRIR
jgi:hypothetical protein